MNDDVTIVIPTIVTRSQRRHGRAPLLHAALASARRQTVSTDIIVRRDDDREGAAINRGKALAQVETTWVAFLDDDDYLYDHHVETLLGLLRDHDADYAYSWFSGESPFPSLRGRQMDLTNPHHTTMTVMVRTELAQEAGFTSPSDPNAALGNEDWRFLLRCIELGARFAGTGEITWHYRRHPGKTGGMPWRVR